MQYRLQDLSQDESTHVEEIEDPTHIEVRIVAHTRLSRLTEKRIHRCGKDAMAKSQSQKNRRRRSRRICLMICIFLQYVLDAQHPPMSA